jgi:peptide/nickel transport system permease protein
MQSVDTPNAATVTSDDSPNRSMGPVASMLAWRIPLGIISIFVIAIITYLATRVLPGDAATAVLGQSATPGRLAQLRHQLGLDRPFFEGLGGWLGGALHGDFGRSLLTNAPVQQMVLPRLANSLILVATVAIVSGILGVASGLWAADRRDGWFDTVTSALALIAAALPEFVVAVFVILLLSVGGLHLFPAVSLLEPGELITSEPAKLVLPVITLTIVVTPYMFRMVRAAVIEALDSDYADQARLKGVTTPRLLLGHAFPNAIPPVVQVFGLNLLYLAGGIVIVETVFQFPGIGLTLVQAITGRDIPVIQFIVLILALFYVVLNTLTDVTVLLFTPRRRAPR